MPKARDIMNPNPPHCDVETSISEIASRFADEDISGMLVVDEEDRLLGIITETDLIDQQRNLHLPTAIAVFDMVIPVGEGRFEKELERMQALTAEDLMARGIKSVAPDATLDEVAGIMADENLHHLPVIEKESVIGVISKHDVIRALAGKLG